MGLFAAPNRAGIMNSLPSHQRGVGAGMSTVFQNSAMVLSIGILFSLMIIGLSAALPRTLLSGLTAQGVPHSAAAQVAALPRWGCSSPHFSATTRFRRCSGPHVLAGLPLANAQYLTGRGFFPTLISGPFAEGLGVAFGFAIAACVIAALASAFRGGKYIYDDRASAETVHVPHPDLLPALAGTTPAGSLGRADESGVRRPTPARPHGDLPRRC